MRIIEKALSCSLPVEYFATAPFLNGMYFITYEAVYKYLITDRIEKYPFPRISPSFSRVQCTETGDYLIFTQKNVQTIYNPAINYLDKVTLAGFPTTTLVDRYTIINVIQNEMHIYQINSKESTIKYRIEQSRLVNRYKIRRITKQDEKILLLEDKIIEIKLKTKDMKPSILLGAGSLDQIKIVPLEKPVIIEPEPITFCTEPLEEIVCTKWGGIMKYTTGIEVYRNNYGQYKLEYIYKTAGKILNMQDMLEAEEKIYIEEKTEKERRIVEIGKDGPILMLSLKEREKAHLINSNTILVQGMTDRIVKCVREERTYQTASIEMKEEKSIQMKEDEIIEESMEYIKKYQEIEYVLPNATEEENALYIEKILNSFKEDVTTKILTLSIMLSKKISYIKEMSEDIERIEEKTKKKVCEVSEKNEDIIRKMGILIKEMQMIKDTHVEEDDGIQDKIAHLKDRMAQIKEKIHNRFTQEKITKQKGEYFLLKQQNEYLMKRLKMLY